MIKARTEENGKERPADHLGGRRPSIEGGRKPAKKVTTKHCEWREKSCVGLCAKQEARQKNPRGYSSGKKASKPALKAVRVEEKGQLSGRKIRKREKASKRE